MVDWVKRTGVAWQDGWEHTHQTGTHQNTCVHAYVSGHASLTSRRRTPRGRGLRHPCLTPSLDTQHSLRLMAEGAGAHCPLCLPLETRTFPSSARIDLERAVALQALDLEHPDPSAPAHVTLEPYRGLARLGR